MSPLKHITFTIIVLGLGALPVQSQDATAIVQKAYDNMQGESSRANMTMTIVRPSWKRSIAMKAWSMGEDYSLILVTAPARDKGSAYLKRGNEIWNWLPNINRTIKLPPSMMSQSWMGSDFSNNDLVREASIVVDYNHTLLGDTTISGYDTHKIQLEPRATAPVVWEKVILFVTKDEFLQLRAEFYDENGKLVRLMEGSEIREMGGRMLPSRMEMTPVEEKDKKTIIVYNSIEFNINISERFFSIQNMKRLQ
ncbi:outer membrane lipoprotein-sorting protein [Fodinibius sediminis]|uniref:Outer membrane lipoprotein-sorting protein n=1 Tax=Fodinibius sediminis TaxID=1214077 RepID=A0A521BXC6_9BACT|nr:outer membrane lipoprotein-sorting protein [Fodinibius sediminis]SMO51854.1 outer membrane lipoprotein-sorting protein [Fodinibius sediminis]